ncbi:MAG: hypothetical protein K2M31_02310 [Muribaculaceae bacterium]|nr:hypothetical protein [Muribaculaceae bacterium]
MNKNSKNISPSKGYGNDSNRRDSLIAAGVTIFVALLIFCFLYWGQVGMPRMDMAAASTPEIDQEELFLEPDLLDEEQPPMEAKVEDVGEPESETSTEAAPEALGEPEKAEPKEEVRIPDVKGKSETKTPPKDKLITQKQESPVKTQEPSGKETKKIADPTANAFSPHNGKKNGRDGQAGAGGSSTGITGTANGWSFQGCPKPSVTLSNRVTVRVNVTVDEKGNVTSAKASGATPEINAACRQAALQAKWKPSDPNNRRKASGTITFTISPK